MNFTPVNDLHLTPLHQVLEKERQRSCGETKKKETDETRAKKTRRIQVSKVVNNVDDNLKKQIKAFSLHPCVELKQLYSCRALVSEGTYGSVYRGENQETKETVAIKKMKFIRELSEDGFPRAVLNEIQYLQRLSVHPNIIKLKNVVSDCTTIPTSIALVFDFLPLTLHEAVRNNLGNFTIPVIKKVMRDILSGVSEMHKNYILHRDLKPKNILYNAKDRTFQICDLGSCRSFSEPPIQTYTRNVCSIPFAPPEAFLASGKTFRYGPAFDVWSLGMIFFFMLKGECLFESDNSFEALRSIFSLVGAPITLSDSVKMWDPVSNARSLECLPLLLKELKLDGKAELLYNPNSQPGWHRLFPLNVELRPGIPKLSCSALNLLQGMLAIDPKKRLTIPQVLEHLFFKDEEEVDFFFLDSETKTLADDREKHEDHDIENPAAKRLKMMMMEDTPCHASDS